MYTLVVYPIHSQSLLSIVLCQERLLIKSFQIVEQVSSKVSSKISCSQCQAAVFVLSSWFLCPTEKNGMSDQLIMLGHVLASSKCSVTDVFDTVFEGVINYSSCVWKK